MSTETKQTPEVTKFLADAHAWPWEIFHLICMDGSFFPASTDAAVLNAAVRKFGCAGFIGIVKTQGGKLAQQMIRPYGIETPEAAEALKAAADALSPTSVVCNVDPQTGELSN